MEPGLTFCERKNLPAALFRNFIYKKRHPERLGSNIFRKQVLHRKSLKDKKIFRAYFWL
jgi:hypothetical protein